MLHGSADIASLVNLFFHFFLFAFFRIFALLIHRCIDVVNQLIQVLLVHLFIASLNLACIRIHRLTALLPVCGRLPGRSTFGHPVASVCKQVVSDDATAHAVLTRCFLVLLVLVTITVVVAAVVLRVRCVCHRVLRKLFLRLERPVSRLLYRDLVLLLAALAHLFLLELNDFLSVFVEVCI